MSGDQLDLDARPHSHECMDRYHASLPCNCGADEHNALVAEVRRLRARVERVEESRAEMHRLSSEAKSTDSRLTFRWIAAEFDKALDAS